jgi:predicted Zn-dependent protease
MNERRRQAGWPWRRALGGVAALVIAACAATGGPLGLSREQEKALGEQQHPQILAEFGGEIEDADLKAYVDGLTRRLVAAGDYPTEPVVVTTLDSPVVNAFALPGHVYVTRGLLALSNSEAELAGVLGHELGHVYARHTAQRVSRSNVTGLGAVLIGILTGSQQGMQIAGQLGQLYLLKYSRGQEYEADLIGVRLLARAGYDPTAEADFLQTLGRWTDLELREAGRNSRPPEFLSTHPNSAERVRRAAAEAQVLAQAGGTPTERGRPVFLQRIDGMLYGDDPVKQGFVRGAEFIHPGLRLAFSVPPEFKLVNTPSAVLAQAPSGAQMQFVGATSQKAPASLVEQDLSQALGVSLAPARNISVNGRAAAVGFARAQTQSGVVDVQAFAIRWQDSQYYVFLWVTPPAETSRLRTAIDRSVASLQSVDPRSIAVPPAQEIEIAVIGPADSVASLASRTAFPSAREERFLAMNGLSGAADLKVGEKVKLVQ